MLKPDKKIKFRTRFRTTQLFKFTSTKDRTLFERTEEHAWSSKESALRHHLDECKHFHELFGILSLSNDLFNDDTNIIKPSLREFSIESVRKNVEIIDYDTNWNYLLYKEALHIERLNPSLNSGFKASRALNLFK